jgi:hypothetical protein
VHYHKQVLKVLLYFKVAIFIIILNLIYVLYYTCVTRALLLVLQNNRSWNNGFITFKWQKHVNEHIQQHQPSIIPLPEVRQKQGCPLGPSGRKAKKGGPTAWRLSCSSPPARERRCTFSTLAHDQRISYPSTSSSHAAASN